MTVCPQKAISKSNGWTIIDQNKCIGCGACEEKCIYNVPHVSKKEFMEYGTGKTIQKNKSYKCHACLLNKRDTPACVTACPTGALTIDLRIAIIKAAKKRLKDVKEDFPKASIYGMDQFGGLNVITLLKNNPRKYGLELNPKPIKLADSNIINDLYTLLSLFTLGLPSLKRVAYRIAKTITSTDNRMAS